jgi:hypothetical protein
LIGRWIERRNEGLEAGLHCRASERKQHSEDVAGDSAATGRETRYGESLRHGSFVVAFW